MSLMKIKKKKTITFNLFFFEQLRASLQDVFDLSRDGWLRHASVNGNVYTGKIANERNTFMIFGQYAEQIQV